MLIANRVKRRFLYLATEALSSLIPGSLLQLPCSQVRNTGGALWSGGRLVFPVCAVHSSSTPSSRCSLQLECLSLHLWPVSTCSDFKTQFKHHLFPTAFPICPFLEKTKCIFLCAPLTPVCSPINHVNVSFYSVPAVSSQLGIMNELLKDRDCVTCPYVMIYTV